MLESPLAPYLLWAKTRRPALLDLAGSNLLHCTIDELAGAREALDITAPNDNGYAPIVQAIASLYAVNPDRVVTGTGCSGANFITAAALIAAGDDVLVEQPTYDPLLGACRLMGANVLRFERPAHEDFAIDPGDVRRHITPRTRLIIVTSPHNPSGIRIPAAVLRELADIAAESGAHLLVDEVYLAGACFVSGETLSATSATSLQGPVVVTSSLTKSYGLAGLRSGWAIAPPATAERMRRARDVIDNASSAPADRLAALAWSQYDRLASRATALLETNLAIAREFFAAHPDFVLPERPSCSVCFPRIAGVADAESFVQTLLDRHGVAVAPGRFFDSPAHFRISLAGKTETLERGLQVLGQESRARHT
jgi:aspartate/methionine/tyrosine aminotransferase